jgi:transglutaminase-like putative cysteine protease
MSRRFFKSSTHLLGTLFGLAMAGGVLWGCSAGGGQRATYAVRHQLEVQVPGGAHGLRVWFALPQEESDQEVKDLQVKAPFAHRVTTDSQGNRMLFLEAKDPPAGGFQVVTTFNLKRDEVRKELSPGESRPLTGPEAEGHRQELAPSRMIVINDEIRRLSSDITKGEKNPVAAARAIYDWEIANIDYWVKDPVHHQASPLGSTEYCLSTRTGNCSDYHSLYASLARASGIPARIVYGSLFKKELDGKDEDQSYHCWVEIYVPGKGWAPVDASIADIYRGDFKTTPENELLVRRTTPDGYFGPDPKRVDYYFGNLEDRRVTWSRGRDLVLDPPQNGPPVNALIKAYVEVDGQPVAEKAGWTRKLTYRQLN